MVALPTEHIEDNHKLVADGRVDLFALTPPASGTVYFKADADATWQGHFYAGVPLSISGEKLNADSGLEMPQLTIGQPDIDLSLLKALVFDGYVDNATLVRYTVLRQNLENDVDIKEVRSYRVKRVTSYSRTQIVLQLATISDSLGFRMPVRQYLPPAFPSVRI